MKVKRLLSTILAIAMVLVLCPSTQIIFAEGELTAIQPSGTVTATALTPGSLLGMSALTGTFVAVDGDDDTSNDVTVSGTFAWDEPATLLTTSGDSYRYTFTPTNSNTYDSYQGEAVVLLDFDKDTALEETILEDSFDNTTLFQTGVAGNVTGEKGTWTGIYAAAADGNHVVSGTNAPTDKHNVFYDNRVMALSRYANNAGTIITEFQSGNIGQTNDFTIRFRVCRVEDVEFLVGLGFGAYAASGQHVAVVFNEDGSVALANGTPVIAEGNAESKLAKNVWATVELTTDKGGVAAGSYTVTVTPDDGEAMTGTGTASNTYGSTNTHKMTIYAPSIPSVDGPYAYVDDIKIVRTSKNSGAEEDYTVWLDQDFDDTTEFVTDKVYTEYTSSSSMLTLTAPGGKWQLINTTVDEVAVGSYVTNVTEGDHYICFADTGYQALHFSADSGNNIHGAIAAGYFGTSAFDVAEDDFEISFRMYWMGDSVVQMPLGRSRVFNLGLAYTQIGADGTVYVTDTDGSSVTKASDGKMPVKVWTTITLVSDRDTGTFTVTVAGDDGTNFSVDGHLSTMTGNLGYFWFYCTTTGADGGYLDNFKFVKISSGERTVMIDQTFEDIAMFDSLTSYAYGGSDSITFAADNENASDRWAVQVRATGTESVSPVISTIDGDGTNPNPVFSNTQAIKPARLDSSNRPFNGEFLRAIDYTKEDYRLSFKYRAMDGPFQITMGHNGSALYRDSGIGFTAARVIQTLDETGAFINTDQSLVAGVWYEVILETNRAQGTYTVDLVPQCEGFDTLSVTGVLTSVDITSNNDYVCFYAGLGATAGYLDDVKLDILTPDPTQLGSASVTFSQDWFDGEATVAKGEAPYTFALKTDGDEAYYNYTVTATVGGITVSVTDAGNGEYSVGPIGGNVVISATRTEKTYGVTLVNENAADVAGFVSTATYNTNYALSINAETGYDYTVSAAVGGGEAVALEGLAQGEQLVYTLSGALITGDVVITVGKTLKNYEVTVGGNGAEDVTYVNTVTHGDNYTFTVDTGVADYEILAWIAGVDAPVINNGDGSYTVENVTGALTITAGRFLLVEPDEELMITVPIGRPLKEAIVPAGYFVEKANGEPIEGTVSWGNPILWMDGDKEVDIVFTPSSADYKAYAGKVMVYVTGEPTATPVAGQNFDVTEDFVLGAAGNAVDGWTYADSAVVQGSNPPADSHNALVQNQYVELTRFDGASGYVEGIFPKIEDNTDYVASVRLKHTGAAITSITVGYGGKSASTPDTVQSGLDILADGTVKLGAAQVAIGTLPADTWADIIITSDQDNNEFTVTVDMEGGESFTGTTTMTELNYNLAKITFGVGYTDDDTTLAYIDSVRVDEVVGTVNNTIMWQDFSDATLFPENTVFTSSIVDDGLGGTWTLDANSGGTDSSKVISANGDGDYYNTLTTSGNQALYLHRATNGNRFVSVGHTPNGSNNPYISTDVLSVDDSFEYSFDFYWLGGYMEVFFSRMNANEDYCHTYFQLNSDGTFSVFGSPDDTTTKTTSSGSVPMETWCKITVTGNRSTNMYTIKVDGEEYVTGHLKARTMGRVLGGLIFRPGYNARAGYLDNLKMDKVTITDGEITAREVLIDQDFENTNHFDTAYSYANNGHPVTFDMGGTEGYWRIGFTDADFDEPLVINTQDGDGADVDFVYSNTQALQLTGGNQLVYALENPFAATQNYSFSARVRLERDKTMTISFTDGENADAQITLNNETLMPITWATVELTTDRNTGKYTVTVTPNVGAKYAVETQGDLGNVAISQIVFASEDAEAIAYVDNVSLNKLDLVAGEKPTYTATLPEGMVALNTPTLGETFQFTVANDHYIYSNVAAMMDSANAEVSLFNGIYSIANVGGDITVTATKAPKTYQVTLTGATGETTATYGTDYTFGVALQDGYICEVKIRYAGGLIDVTDNGDGTYTIPGANILGDMTITATQTPVQYTVTWSGEGNADVAGKVITVDHAQAYSFVVNKQANYTYTVSATVDGNPIAVTANGSQYTIEAGVITGDVVITVEKALTAYDVTFTKPDALEITGGATATHGAAYSFSFTPADGVTYVVSATVDGEEIAVTDNGGGSYTVAEGLVTGELAIKIQISGTVTVTVTNATVEAGKALGTATYTLNKSVDGTFAWVRPSTWMNESKECAYIFTPDDPTLAPVEGRVMVTTWSANMVEDEVILEQNFDDEERFQVEVAGDAGTANGSWTGIYAANTSGSTVVHGEKTPADQHNTFVDNRVFALKYMDYNNHCPVKVKFPNGNMGQTNDFVVRFRITRLEDAEIFLGLGIGNFTAAQQHAAVVIAENGDIIIGDSPTSIGNLEKNTWATVEMTSNKGGVAIGEYTVTVTPDGGEAFSGTGTTKGNAALADGGYGSSNVNTLTICSTEGTDNTVVAYLDDVYVERVTTNPVQVDEDFNDTSIFTTDVVPTGDVTGSAGETWQINTYNSNGSYVVNTEYGDHYISNAYSGYQAVQLTTTSANAYGAALLAGNFGSSGLPAGESFEASFKLFWLGKPMQIRLGRLISSSVTYTAAMINIDESGVVTAYNAVGADTLTNEANGRMVANDWVTVTFTSTDATSYTATATLDGENLFTVTGARQNVRIESVIFDGNTTEDATIGYMDDIKVVNTTDAVTLLDENFEDLSVFDATQTYSHADVSGSLDNNIYTIISNGYNTWKMGMRSNQVNTPFISNTIDGDGTNPTPVASNYQAIEVGRYTGGSALDGNFTRKLDYTAEDYRLSFKFRFTGAVDIIMGHTNLAHADSGISITSAYAVSTVRGGAFTDTGATIAPYIWYNVVLETNRAENTYTVTFQPLCNGFETVVVTGEPTDSTTTSNNGYLRFYSFTPNTNVGYLDDVRLVTLEPEVAPQESYTVTLPAGVSGNATVLMGEDYTFTINDYDANYDYTFTATMGDSVAEVIDNGDGTYTIEGVCGNIVINGLDVTAKTYNIIFTGDGAPDAVGSATADYGTEYTFTLTKDENYDYVVTVGGVEQTPDEEGTYTITVTGDMEIAVAKTEKVINVNVDWGVMIFEYEHTSWDAETHSWNGAWNPDGTNYITVTNIGGVAITVRYYFAVEQGKPVNRVTSWNFTSDAAGETVISEAVPLEVGADPYTAYLNLTGAPTTAFENEKLGTATVEIQ